MTGDSEVVMLVLSRIRLRPPAGCPMRRFCACGFDSSHPALNTRASIPHQTHDFLPLSKLPVLPSNLFPLTSSTQSTYFYLDTTSLLCYYLT
jgi:hypothetical protein